MKKVTILGVVGALLLIAGTVSAAEKSGNSCCANEKKCTTVASAKATAQKTCPIMGGAINKSVYEDYQGKRIYFCCNGCPEEFKKSPEKYLKALKEKGETVESIPAKK